MNSGGSYTPSSAPPRLQVQTRGFVTGFAVLGLTLSAIAVLLYGLLRDAWLQSLLDGIALGMSMLPEDFPLVLTVFMLMGAWRLSRSQVLTAGWLRPTPWGSHQQSEEFPLTAISTVTSRQAAGAVRAVAPGRVRAEVPLIQAAPAR